jgi:hypothetical protein
MFSIASACRFSNSKTLLYTFKNSDSNREGFRTEFDRIIPVGNRLCVLVVRVPGYKMAILFFKLMEMVYNALQ